MEKITKTVSVRLPYGNKRLKFKRNDAHYRYERKAGNTYIHFADKSLGDKKYHCAMNISMLKDMVFNAFGSGESRQEAFENMLSKYLENVRIFNRVNLSFGMSW